METEIDLVFRKKGFIRGRSIAWSQAAYTQAYSAHEIYFGSKLFVLGQNEPVWEGDVDLDFDAERLTEIAKTIEKDIYVLQSTEGDDLTDAEIIAKASSIIEYQ